MARFDEVELEPVVFEPAAAPTELTHASRFRRLLGLLTDLSLLAALALALSPLLPASRNWTAVAGLGVCLSVVGAALILIAAWLHPPVEVAS